MQHTQVRSDAQRREIASFCIPRGGEYTTKKEKIANPRGYAAGVTGQIEPCIIALLSFSSYLITKYFEGFPQI